MLAPVAEPMPSTVRPEGSSQVKHWWEVPGVRVASIAIAMASTVVLDLGRATFPGNRLFPPASL